MLSAVAAPDGEWGMLRERNILRSHRFGWDQEYMFQAQSEWTSMHAKNSSKPLDGRAWAYQERVMAPRILHFGEQKLLWECASVNWAEDAGLSQVEAWPVWHEKRHVDRFVRHSSSLWSWEAEDVEDRLQAYYDCIENYSSRALTKPTDKLPAFSGLASAFRVAIFGAFLAGLWETDLLYGLAWKKRDPDHTVKSEDQASEDMEYVAPSWSWASTRHGPISFLRICRAELPQHFWDDDNFKNWADTYKPRLLAYRYQLSTSDPHGKISSAALISLHGHCRTLMVQTNETDMQGDYSAWAAVYLDQGPGGGSPWKFGAPNEYVHQSMKSKWSNANEEKTRQFTALQIGMKPASVPEDMDLVMLILEDVEGSQNTFKRAGILEVPLPKEEMLSEKWEAKQLTII